MSPIGRTFIVLNLILAVVYNDYSDFVKGRVIRANRNRARGLNEAFKLLADTKGDDGSPQISRDAFEKLVEHTNDVERVPRVEAGEVAFFFWDERDLRGDGDRFLGTGEKNASTPEGASTSPPSTSARWGVSKTSTAPQIGPFSESSETTWSRALSA